MARVMTSRRPDKPGCNALWQFDDSIRPNDVARERTTMTYLIIASSGEDAARHGIQKVLTYGIMALMGIFLLLLVASIVWWVGASIMHALAKPEYGLTVAGLAIGAGVLVFAFGASLLGSAITAGVVGCISLMGMSIYALDDE